MKRRGVNQGDLEEFYKEVAGINGVKEVKKYLETMLSPQNLADVARKMQALRFLKEGKTYREIQSEVGVGPTTIRNLRMGKSVEKKVVKAVQDEASIKKRDEKIKYPKRKQPLYYKGWRVR